jgi:predicted nucleic acid-binding protein
MIVILDVSAAIEILLKREKAELFQTEVLNADWVIAPDLYISEISNVLWKYCNANIIKHDESVKIVEDGISIIDAFISSNDIWREALSEGIKNKHSVYDMMYLITARRNDGILMTSDRKLNNLAKKLDIKTIE